MPHKKQKKPHNALQDGSPKTDKQFDLAETSPAKSSALATTNYREIHQNEAEALRSIYGDDFEDVEHRRAAWQVSLKPRMALTCSFLTPFSAILGSHL